MSWPRGRPRPKKVASEEAAKEIPMSSDSIEIFDAPRASNEPPHEWIKGELLNVRNHGDCYVITKYPEEYSPEREERCIKFTNLGECQGFVSDWYSRIGHDPRAR